MARDDRFLYCRYCEVNVQIRVVGGGYDVPSENKMVLQGFRSSVASGSSGRRRGSCRAYYYIVEAAMVRSPVPHRKGVKFAYH